MSKAVVLLSGGLDSSTCLAIALKENQEVYCLSFHYGQRHDRELKQALEVRKYFGIPDDHHILVDLDFWSKVGGSALVDKNAELPENREYEEMVNIPPTYVPARNVVFLSYALGLAEIYGLDRIYIGVNSMDYSGYPDCRPEFIKAFQHVIDLITGGKVYISTPLQFLRKSEIVKLAVENGVPIHLTTSCYKGGEKACGVCDSCRLRLKGFKEAGLDDPIEYEVKEV